MALTINVNGRTRTRRAGGLRPVRLGSYMAQVAEVGGASDATVRVRRVVCADDCGTVVNPDTVRASASEAFRSTRPRCSSYNDADLGPIGLMSIRGRWP